MQTPVPEPALSALGFARVDYDFAFACHSLDPSLPAEAVSPARWHIMPGDVLLPI